MIIAVIFFSACSDTDLSARPSSPELATRYFFEAIYVHRDITKAKPYVDDKIWDLMAHYHIASSVQRHMLNLPMTDVILEITDVDADFFRKFSTSSTVTMKLVGKKNGKNWIATRALKVNKRDDDKWIIDEILPEKMR